MGCDFCGETLDRCECPYPMPREPALNCENCEKPIGNDDAYAVILNAAGFHFCGLVCMRSWASEHLVSRLPVPGRREA
jgi:hypothetical protein